jgi:hypothetical protein
MPNTITILNRGACPDNDAERLLEFTASCALRHIHQDGSSATIYCTDRVPEGKSDAGWLEFVLHVSYATGGEMFIGCIQRKLGAEFEAHS